MSDRVWLVRHAATEWTGHRWCGRTDLPLTALGRAHASELASRLAPVLPFRVVVMSSPARRALETGRVLADAIRGSVEVVDDLREVDFGEAEGRTWPEIEHGVPALAAALAAGITQIDWPGGETWAETRDRAAHVQGRIDSASGPLVLVTHGGLIRALLDGPLGAGGPAERHLGPAAAIEIARIDGVWAIPAVGVA